MFTNTLPASTAQLLEKLKGAEFLQDFYLSGGTALSLQLGHRESEDLDFFNQNSFQAEKIKLKLQELGELAGIEEGEDTLNAFVDKVKIQFLGYPYKLLEPLVDWQGIKLSSVLDIACTKLLTISARGSRKDFIDLYVLLDKFSLNELFLAVEEKYRGSDYNKIHILKSLSYFDDAQIEPMPRLHTEIVWQELKRTIIAEVKKYQF